MVQRTHVGGGPGRAGRRAGGAHGGAAHLAVCPVHHLDKLAALEGEQQVGVALQQARVELLGCLDGLAHTAC